MSALVLGVRFLLELAVLGSLGRWGFTAGGSTSARWLLGLGAPTLAAAVWGVFVSPRAAVPTTPPLRWLLEALVLGSGALALAAGARPALGIALAVVAVVDEVALYGLELD